ncbi:LysR family transcriptional regulator [Ancylobacter sp. 6x-1]|uniref:LysR family transcriptional regulator n=1 Tax=Ancylobacter crimeensis TaxID=2579147 RepID=A0ABT0DE04_9HYPH|nr:LysR family transcriptional regulator [Ancylobacter crimeensis]MCK0198190.1 LysR family transcriptional regulator [Ancylobacter crimeensis]
MASPQLSLLLGRLRLKHLRVLDALAGAGNLHQVAAALNMTQPAATKILQDAEAIVGARLFERRPRGMVLTDLGGFVADYARRMLRETETFSEGLDNLKAGGFGALSIGAIMATTPGLLPRAIAELKRRRPLMTIRLLAATSDILLRALERNEISLALGRFIDPRNALAFDIEPLASEELWVFVAPDHPLATRAAISLGEMATLPWVLQPATSPMRGLIDSTFASAGIGVLNNVVETTSIFATLHLVREAGMVACLPKSILVEGVAAGTFRRLPVHLPNQLGPLGIITRRGEALAVTAVDFISVLHSVAAEATGL